MTTAWRKLCGRARIEDALNEVRESTKKRIDGLDHVTYVHGECINTQAKRLTDENEGLYDKVFDLRDDVADMKAGWFRRMVRAWVLGE